MYLFNPNLNTIKKDFKGNLYQNKMFESAEYGTTKASFKKILRWQLSRNPQKEEKKQDDFRLKVNRNTSFITSDEDLIVWLGHAAFFFRLNGISFMTDPCLKDLPLIKRQVGLPCSIYDLIGIDYLLISHGHRDHFDEASIHQLLEQNPKMELLLPLKISELLGKKKKKIRYQEAGWWQQYKLTDDVEVFFLPARHWNRRFLNDFNRQLWGSFLIRTKDKSIYFGADTGYAQHFKEIRETFGSPDICLLPVGAYKPSYVMQEAHMHPGEAVQAFRDLKGKVMIPMHYGTFDLSDEPLGEPVSILKDLERRGSIEGELRFLHVGEKYMLQQPEKAIHYTKS